MRNRTRSDYCLLYTSDKGLRRFSIVICSAFLLCFGVLLGVVLCEILYKGEEVGVTPKGEENQPRSELPGVSPKDDEVRDLLSLQEIFEKGKNFVVGLLVQTEKEPLAVTGVILTGGKSPYHFETSGR